MLNVKRKSLGGGWSEIVTEKNTSLYRLEHRGSGIYSVYEYRQEDNAHVHIADIRGRASGMTAREVLDELDTLEKDYE